MVKIKRANIVLQNTTYKTTDCATHTPLKPEVYDFFRRLFKRLSEYQKTGFEIIFNRLSKITQQVFPKRIPILSK